MVIFIVTNTLRRARSGIPTKLIACLGLLRTDPSINSMIGKRIEEVNRNGLNKCSRWRKSWKIVSV